ncbi:MAG: exo-alpha-sialidase [Planctomycetes bacterium]|nr:exo-alpha-sialidase [Planctomycetota bacterium]
MKGLINLLLICIFTVLFSLSNTALAGADVFIDGDTNVQNEISLTLVPGHPNDIVMVYNDNPVYGSPTGLGVAHSPDGGKGWNTTQLSFPFEPSGVFQMTRVFDPTITATADANVYAGFIADGSTWAFGLQDSGMYVCKSTDKGKNWGSPVIVSYDAPPTVLSPDPNYRFNDRCQITADNFSGSSHYKNIYIAWIKDRGSGAPLPYSDIYFSRSTDDGQTFSTALMINDANNGMGNMPVHAVAKDGTVYVSWMDYNVVTGGTGTIYIRKSTDGGQTFPNWGTGDHLVRTVNLPPLNVNDGFSNPDAKAKGAAVLAASPTDPNKLYIVYAADPDGAGNDDADIYLIKSADAGQNWSAPLRINNDNTISDQILPWIKIKPNGTIDVAWYDRRNDPTDSAWDVYLAKSIDDGNSFPAQIPINDSSFLTPTNKWLGEYLGLAVDANDAYIAFTTSLSDLINGDVYFDRTPNYQITVPGDFEPDSDVDFRDFAVLANAWRSIPSDSNWNPICDIFDPNDNVIDNNDLSTFVNDWLYGK